MLEITTFRKKYIHNRKKLFGDSFIISGWKMLFSNWPNISANDSDPGSACSLAKSSVPKSKVCLIQGIMIVKGFAKICKAIHPARPEAQPW